MYTMWFLTSLGPRGWAIFVGLTSVTNAEGQTYRHTDRQTTLRRVTCRNMLKLHGGISCGLVAQQQLYSKSISNLPRDWRLTRAPLKQPTCSLYRVAQKNLNLIDVQQIHNKSKVRRLSKSPHLAVVVAMRSKNAHNPCSVVEKVRRSRTWCEWGWGVTINALVYRHAIGPILPDN